MSDCPGHQEERQGKRGHSHPVCVRLLLEEGAGAGQEELVVGKDEDKAEAGIAGHLLAHGGPLGNA